MKRNLCILLLSALLALSLAAPALAGTAYVTDNAGLLTASEISALDAAAEDVAQRYGVGIYILTVQDYTDIDGRGAYEAAYTAYHRAQLGVGEERSGAILLLSMRGRDFATFFYGTETEYAFNSYGQEQLEDAFLDNFRVNDWYGGFSDYIAACGEYLALAESGHPVRRSPALAIGISCIAAVLVALLVCSILKRKMKSVYVQAAADGYAAGTLRLTRQDDRFTHRTETRRRIEPPKSSGGGGSSAHVGGGGSGRSGKF